MHIEVVVQVVLQQLLQRIKLRLRRVVHVAFSFCHFAQALQSLLAHLVILELRRVDRCLELLIDAVGYLKVFCTPYALVLCRILRAEVKRPVVADDVVYQSVDLRIFYLHVGRDASTVAHLTPVGGMEHRGEAVGNPRHCPVGVAVRVVDGLYQASARYVVFRDSHLQQPFVGQRARGLHQSFAK